MDVDPKTKSPISLALATRNQKKRLLLGNSEIQLSENDMAVDHGGEEADVNSRYARNILDIEEIARGLRTNKDLSPPRDQPSNRSSCGGRKDPSPQELGYQNDIAQRNALLADKELEIQRLNYLLDQERSERIRTELAIEKEWTQPGGQRYTWPRDIQMDKER